MKYRFYDENMHGYDWDGVRARYEPLLKYVGQNQDLYDLANEMIGELNASHTGVSGAQRYGPAHHLSIGRAGLRDRRRRRPLRCGSHLCGRAG